MTATSVPGHRTSSQRKLFSRAIADKHLPKRYNPELQKRSLEGRDQRLKDANDFIAQLKEYSKSDKPSMFISLKREIQKYK